MSGDASQTVVLGEIVGIYGVKGWIKIHSWTQPRAGILSYSPWALELNGEISHRDVENGRSRGRGLIAKLHGVEDRDSARSLFGATIAVPRSALPSSDDYYWVDIVGLRVETLDGTDLGTVETLIETGANDVLVVQGDRERLIPFLHEKVVREVSLDRGRIRVDWEPDF